MFVNNPTFTSAGEIGVARTEVRCLVPSDVTLAATYVLRAFQLVTALRDLQTQTNGAVINERLAMEIRREISEFLRKASDSTYDDQLRASLQKRAESFLSGDFSSAALSYAEEKTLPLEVVVGTIPSWRFASHPRVYAGILATPLTGDGKLLQLIDDKATKVAAEISRALDGKTLQPSVSPPHFVSADLLGLAGDTLQHPIHMANFFPDDEGVYKNPSTKSVIYRNIYTSRYAAVSLPLANRSCEEQIASALPQDNHAWIHLLAWFRGHDLGHTYFDQHCKSLLGLPKFKRYVLQETCADLFGLALAVSLCASDKTLCDNPDHQVAVFLSEMLRFLKRDRQIFPDASAAWFELSSCLESEVITITSTGRLAGKVGAIGQYLNRMLEALSVSLLNGESAYVEALINRRCGFTGDMVEALPLEIERLLKTRMECTEIDPILADADLLLEKFQTAPNVQPLRLRDEPFLSEGRCCPRF